MTKTFEVLDEKFESSKRAFTSYIVGFLLSLVISFISFFLVIKGLISSHIGLAVITFLGVTQLLVQVFFFLHLPIKRKPYWNVLVFFFTLIIVSFLVIGSLWIMYHLNMNMMGMSPFKSNEGYIPQ
jgi:cytochrome o ubiquinol oxidase operon protein cyoD